MSLWNMKLSSELVDFNGRVLPPEDIIHGGGFKSKGTHDADWTKTMRNGSMLLMGNLQSWVVICVGHMKRDAQGFIGTLIKAASSLHFNIPQPQL